ncbi:MAG: FAD-dependent thymidylate synthase [Clostridiales bacterium]|nr:FAD-dependent thymidylate synthase [Clostridiales bacterium]
MNTGGAKIVSVSNNGVRMCAAAARISTTDGGAQKAIERGDGDKKDLKLIGKVIASGHKTILEHLVFTIAFQDVSVLAEQGLIEFRLASYTVKSRRYVDFSGAGYVTPTNLTEEMSQIYKENMDARFEDYKKLLELGIAREDARFVLPYCFKSNFYMTLNARELAHVIASMKYGRLSRYEEFQRIGVSLEAQLKEIMGDTDISEKPSQAKYAHKDKDFIFSSLHVCAPEAEVVIAPENPEKALDFALRLTDRFESENAIRQLVRDARPRELEMLSYGFTVKNVSLSCVTHFTRHRMQSLIVPYVEEALLGGGYVLPKSVKNNKEALAVYENAFKNNLENAKKLHALGADKALLAYFALSGNTVDILFTMNARELLHFMKLRTCTRAQWEIRDAASDMLSGLMESFPALFRYFGPSCAVNGFCPEGRLSCGRLQKMEE